MKIYNLCTRLICTLLCTILPYAFTDEQDDGTASPWSGTISFAGEYRYGNQRIKSSTLSADALFSKKNNEFLSNIRSYFASDDTGIIARNSALSAKYDRLLTERLSWYVSEELLNNRFKDLDLRSTSGTGAAYRIWKSDRKKLTVEIGAAYITEDRIVYENTEETSGRAAAQMTIKNGGGIVFKESIEILPSFEKGGEYLLKNDFSILTGLGAGWALKLNHLLQHDTDPPENIRKTDVTLSLGIQYSF